MTPAERKVVEQTIGWLNEGRNHTNQWDWTYRSRYESLDASVMTGVGQLQTLLSLAADEPETHP